MYWILIKSETTMKILLWFFLLATLIAGCEFGAPQKTPALIFPSSVSPSPTSISAPSDNFARQCLEVLRALPENVEIKGNLVLRETDFPFHYQDSTYILRADGSKIDLPLNKDEIISSEAISPNHRWVAYFAEPSLNPEAPDRVVVVNQDGEQVFSKILEHHQWLQIDGWADNEHLLIDKWQSLPDIHLATPLPVVVLNPFTSEEIELPPSYPDMVYLYPKFYWREYGYSGAGYSPDLKLVAYARQDGMVVLWNVFENREVIAVQGAATFGDGPAWFSDDSKFVIDSVVKPTESTAENVWQEELYVIESNGKITRMTSLIDLLGSVSVGGYKWSPDGRYIAFSLATESASGFNSLGNFYQSWALLDTTTKQVTVYCIPGNYDASPIVWSPDGTQLLVNMEQNDALVHSYDTVWIDIEKKLAVKIAENTVPEGWLTDEP